MADNHTLNTRIKLKYDTYENWIAKDPVLLAGEVAIATVATNDTNKTNTGFQNLPNIVFKVGDGSSTYSQLKFVSALAADVHGWAKEAKKPTYEATEITGIQEYIDNIIAGTDNIQDTDTKYIMETVDGNTYKYGLYSTNKAGENKTLVYTLDLSAVDTRLDDVEAALGENGSVAEAINTAIGSLNFEKQPETSKFITGITQSAGIITGVQTAQPAIADVSGLQTALDAKQNNLEFDGTYDATNNKVATVATVTGQIDALNGTDKEDAGKFVVYTTQEKGLVSSVKRAITENDLPALSIAKTTGLQDALDSKQDALVFSDNYAGETNPVATVATVTKAVANLEGAMHFIGVVESDPTTWSPANPDSKYNPGDVVLFGIYEFVFDGAAWWPLGAEGIYQLKADAETQHKAMQDDIDALETNKQDNLGFEGTYNKETNKVVTNDFMVEAINTQIESLNQTHAAEASKFITGITQVAGVITDVTRAQPEIADVNGLTTRLSGIDTEVAKKQDILQIADNYNADTNHVATVATVTGQIDALNAGDAAVEGQFVTAVPQTNGKIAVSRANVTTDHIKQGTLPLVFDCGTATL